LPDRRAAGPELSRFMLDSKSSPTITHFWLRLCQNRAMARGWESKDVEAQVESKDGNQSNTRHGAKTPEEQVRDLGIKDLQLSRTRIVNDLASATNPNHRKSLEAALAHLDKKIAALS
jgi:hypothetical protein